MALDRWVCALSNGTRIGPEERIQTSMLADLGRYGLRRNIFKKYNLNILKIGILAAIPDGPETSVNDIEPSK